MTEISGEWKALSYNQYRADIRRQSVSQSVSEGSTPKVVHMPPSFLLRTFCRFPRKIAVFSAPLGSAVAHNIRFVFAQHFWDGGAAAGEATVLISFPNASFGSRQIKKTFRLWSFSTEVEVLLA